MLCSRMSREPAQSPRKGRFNLLTCLLQPPDNKLTKIPHISPQTMKKMASLLPNTQQSHRPLWQKRHKWPTARWLCSFSTPLNIRWEKMRLTCRSWLEGHFLAHYHSIIDRLIISRHYSTIISDIDPIKWEDQLRGLNTSIRGEAAILVHLFRKPNSYFIISKIKVNLAVILTWQVFSEALKRKRNQRDLLKRPTDSKSIFQVALSTDERPRFLVLSSCKSCRWREMSSCLTI